MTHDERRQRRADYMRAYRAKRNLPNLFDEPAPKLTDAERRQRRAEYMRAYRAKLKEPSLLDGDTPPHLYETAEAAPHRYEGEPNMPEALDVQNPKGDADYRRYRAEYMRWYRAGSREYTREKWREDARRHRARKAAAKAATEGLV
jgi:hypothetical protein